MYECVSVLGAYLSLLILFTHKTCRPVSVLYRVAQNRMPGLICKRNSVNLHQFLPRSGVWKKERCDSTV